MPPSPALRDRRPASAAVRWTHLWAGLALAVALLLAGAGGAARAQPSAGTSAQSPTGAYATRAALAAALADAERRGARDEAARYRERLSGGDIRVGDRLTVTLVVDSARQYDVVVREGQLVEFQPLGRADLRGVLRSELQPALQRFFAQFYRTPEIQVVQLVRVGVLGAVGRPGYYAVPPDALVTDLISGQSPAGGPAGNADPNRIEVKRGNRTVLDRGAYRRAARDGLTIADVGIRSGDELRVAERKNRNIGQIIQNTLLALSAFTTLVFLIRSANS